MQRNLQGSESVNYYNIFVQTVFTFLNCIEMIAGKRKFFQVFEISEGFIAKHLDSIIPEAQFNYAGTNG